MNKAKKLGLFKSLRLKRQEANERFKKSWTGKQGHHNQLMYTKSQYHANGVYEVLALLDLIDEFNTWCLEQDELELLKHT